MNLDPLHTVRVTCPYCGERLSCSVDTSVNAQEYVEDCYVCCQPIIFSVEVDEQESSLQVALHQENE